MVLGVISGFLLILAIAQSADDCIIESPDPLIVKHFQNQGIDPAIPRTVSFLIYTQDSSELADIQNKLQSMAMTTKILDRLDGRTLVVGNLEMLLDPIQLSNIRCELTTYLQGLDAYYEGWGTGQQPSP